MPALRRASLDAKDSVAVVTVHLSKAFDGVNHNLLLTKLKEWAYGFSTTATNFKELLQRSKDWRYLFWMEVFQSRCSPGMSAWSIIMAPRLRYTDDTTGYINANASSLTLQFMVNKNLSTLSTWFEQNFLSINKTTNKSQSSEGCML